MQTKSRIADHEVLLHPERIRIVAEFVGRDGRTAAELREQLTDIPAAKLYRDLALLTDARILEVRETRAMRGAHEKTYVLASKLLFSADDLMKSPARFLQVVTTVAAMLIGDFARYLRRTRLAKRTVDPMLRAYVVDATDAEYRALTASLNDALAQAGAAGLRSPGAARKRRLFYLAAVPDAEARP